MTIHYDWPYIEPPEQDDEPPYEDEWSGEDEEEFEYEDEWEDED